MSRRCRGSTAVAGRRTAKTSSPRELRIPSPSHIFSGSTRRHGSWSIRRYRGRTTPTRARRYGTSIDNRLLRRRLRAHHPQQVMAGDGRSAMACPRLDGRAPASHRSSRRVPGISASWEDDDFVAGPSASTGSTSPRGVGPASRSSRAFSPKQNSTRMSLHPELVIPDNIRTRDPAAAVSGRARSSADSVDSV